MTATTAHSYGPDYYADQDTATVLASMLTENTGRHMMDSGDAYGRNWERNQGRTVEDFKAQPTAWAEPDRYGPLVTLSLFHWLDDRLSFEPFWQRRFEVFTALHNGQCGNSYGNHRFHCNCSWQELCAMFAETYRDDTQSTGYTGDMAEGSFNSYNGEEALSQTIQVVYFTARDLEDRLGGETVVLLQVHGGADVRGGYTEPKAFTLRETYDSVYSLYDWDSYDMVCEPEPYEPPQPETLPAMPHRPAPQQHYFSHRSGEWTDQDGSFTPDPWRDNGREPIATDDNGDDFTPCPVCGRPVSFYGQGM